MSDNVLVIAGEDGSFRIEDDSLPKGDPLRLLGRFANAKKLAGAFGMAMLSSRGHAEAFRELRAAWFEEVLAAWTLFDEDDDDAIRRQNANTLFRAEYDQQTEAILRGEELSVAPRDAVDLT